MNTQEPWSPRPADKVVRHPRMERMLPVRIELPTERAARRLRSQLARPSLVLVWTFGLLIGLGTALLSMPFSHHGDTLLFVDALFTATSAATVTGLVTVETASYWTLQGQMVILGLMFVGGLGIMTIATALFVIAGQRISLSQRLVMRETIGTTVFTNITSITVRIVIWAVVVQLIGFIALLARFLFLYPPSEALWHSVFQAVSGFNNAGFTSIPDSASLSAFREDPGIIGTVAVLILLGSISYWVMADIVRRKHFSSLTLNSKLVLVFTVGLVLVGALVFYVFESRNDEMLRGAPILDRLATSVFQSINRTSGFSTIDFGEATDETSAFYTVLMYIGGASASVAGGIKVNSFALIVIAIAASVRGSSDATAFGRRVPLIQVQWAFALAFLSFMGASMLTFALAFTESGHGFLDLLFEAVSAFGTVGFSTGLTGDLSIQGKLLLIAGMFVGRVVPPMVITVALSGSDNLGFYSYAREDVLVS